METIYLLIKGSFDLVNNKANETNGLLTTAQLFKREGNMINSFAPPVKSGGVTFKEDAGRPDAPKKASTPSMFLMGCLAYVTLVPVPVHIGFGVDVKNMWGVVIPTLVFGWLIVIGGRK